jgi:predicted homoserine dehydrogenase-like protein
MLDDLRQREKAGQPIYVGIVGLGSMGLAIAHQVSITPGMCLGFVADRDIRRAEKAAKAGGGTVHVTTDAVAALENHRLPCDVLVEATNSIVAAYDYCMAAINRQAHVVLMNAEVDLALGFLLRAAAQKSGVVVTSDAGDQHGVLSRLVDEISLWGLGIVQAGNMKGFLDRHRTLAGSVEIARSLRLSPVQCLAYTDGSKLNIEMAIVANQCGLTPEVPGMRGPAADRVEDVMALFDFERPETRGRVDYILGAGQHGGGVYVVAHCEHDMQGWYLNYYKVVNRHPYYLFFRPYHLCHLETPRAIALAALYGKAVCTMKMGRLTDCYAYAKRRLVPSSVIQHGIGSDEVYGLVDTARAADDRACIPQVLLESEEGPARPVVRKTVGMDMPVTWDVVALPESRLLALWNQQAVLLASASPVASARAVPESVV